MRVRQVEVYEMLKDLWAAMPLVGLLWLYGAFVVYGGLHWGAW